MNFYNSKKSSNYLKGIFEAASEGILFVDASGHILRSNPAFYTLLGYKKDELNGKLFAEIVHSTAEVQKVTCPLELFYFQHSNNVPLRVELINRKGETVPVKFRSVLLKDNKQKIIEAIGIVEVLRGDRGEGTLEQGMRETENRLNNIIESSRDGIAVSDHMGFITRVNKSFLKLINFGEEEVIGKHIAEFTPYEKGTYESTTGELVEIGEEFISNAMAIVEKLFKEGTLDNWESYYLRKDRKIVPVEVTIAYFYNEEGDIIGSVGINRDITARKKAEEALKMSEAKYYNLIEHANDAIISTNKEGVVIGFNKKAEEMLGYSRDEIVGKHITLLSPPSDRERERKALEGLKKTKTLGVIGKTLEGKGLKKNGQEIPVESSVYALEVHGEYIITSILRDISERKRTEERIIEYQNQLRSLASQLTLTEELERRRIATDLHDRISQALAISKIRLGALQESVSSPSLDKEINGIRHLIEQTIQDTRSLIFDLCPPFLYELGFEKALEWLVEELQKQHGVTALFENDGKPKPLDDSVRILLFRTVNELLINIVKHAHAQKAKVSVYRDGDTIQINVEDDGVGFDTSKPQHHVDKTGGFGLFRIRERLHYLGGQFKVTSQLHHGTKVSLVVPIKFNGEIAKETIR